ncbi:MAG TPA: hypothetical protein VLU73_13825, partial [Methylococcaceae bacterium]|nr:hypothetical protein [Methylococcaceae bacterium]
ARSDRNINLGLNNDFGTVAIASGNDVTLRDINAIDLGASRVWGDLSVTAAGSITQSGALTMANSAGGTAKFIVTAVDSDMLLGQANFFGSVSVGVGGGGSVRDLTLRNVNSTAIVPTLPTGLRNLSLQFDGTGMVLPGITVTGDFNATAGRGSITQLDPNSRSGALSVSGAAVFDSAGSEVTLANRNNHFGGTVSVPDDLGTQRNVTLTADRINVGRQGITGKQIVLTADEITSLDDSSLVQVTEPDFTQVGLSLHGLKGDGVFGTFDRPLFVFMDSELQLTPNTPSLTNIVLLAGPPEPKPRYLNGPGRRVVDYNFGLTAPPAGVAALNAAYAPLRRLLSEVLASGYSKENVRKQLAEGLVLETGVAPPALDNIVDEGIRLPEVSCGGIRTASWATSLEC